MAIFRFFELVVFIASKGVFSFLNIVNDLFLPIVQKKKLEKWSFVDQNHGLSPLEKCQFFDFLNFLFLYPRKLLFLCKIW